MTNLVRRLKPRIPTPIKARVRAMEADLRARLFKPYIKKKHIEGVSFDFFIGDLTARDWYDLQAGDPTWAEMRFVRDVLIANGDVVFECGGHHGCTAILLSHWVGDDGRVITFEPVPNNANIIERNIALNGLKNVVIQRKAVGATEGKTVIAKESNSNVLRFPSRGTEVDLIHLDAYSDLRPNLLKLDVQGFEAEVLKGAARILQTRPKIALELHTEILQDYDSSVEEILSLINIDDYQCWIQWKDGEEPVPYDLSTPITTTVHLFALPKERKLLPHKNSCH